MTPEDYVRFRNKEDEQAAAARKRSENMKRLRADRRRPRPSAQRQLEHVREVRQILREARRT